MSDSKQAVAVIGAGNWGRNLVANFHRLGALRVVAEADATIRARLAAEYPGLELVAGYEALVGREDIAAVAIATPAPTHHAVGKAFLEAGQDVFLEKPMTLTSTEAENLVAVAESRGRILMVGHLLMYQPAIEKIRALITEGVIGQVFTIHQERMKLGRARAVENVLWSFGVHDIAVLLHLVGESPSRVSAAGHCGLRDSVEDDVYLHLEFPGGTRAHLHDSWLWPVNRRALTVVGSEGMIVYDEVAGTVTLHRKSIDPATLQNRDNGEDIVLENAPAPLEIELRHFLDCVATRATPKSDGRSGLEVIRVLERAAVS